MREYTEVVLESQVDDDEMVTVTDYGDENLQGGPKITFGTCHIVFQNDTDELDGWTRAINTVDVLLRTLEAEWERRAGHVNGDQP